MLALVLLFLTEIPCGPDRMWNLNAAYLVFREVRRYR